jgi:hypothetical protein
VKSIWPLVSPRVKNLARVTQNDLARFEIDFAYGGHIPGSK